MLDRGKFSKYVSVEFLTVEKYLVHHGKGNRVRVRIAFAYG